MSVEGEEAREEVEKEREKRSESEVEPERADSLAVKAVNG